MRKAGIFVLTILMSIMFSILAFAGVEISSGNFPDEEFRKIVKKYDKDSDGILTAAEISAIQEIDCEKNVNLKDVTGIEYFTSLKSLSVWKCSLSKLNVSKNTQLEYLDCCETGIASLNVRYNPNIHQLWCFGNKIADLDLTNNSYLVKAYSNGIYKNADYISYADEDTASYLALDKTVKLKLPAGTPVSNTGTSSTNSVTSSSDTGTTPVNPGSIVAVGETVKFEREVTLPGDFLDKAFKVECADIVSITQARTGNIRYTDGTTYFFTIWVTGKKPGTTTVTVYDNSKTKMIWSTVITVQGDASAAETVGEEQPAAEPSSVKQVLPKVGTQLTHSGSGLRYVVSKKGKEVSVKGVSGKKTAIKVPQTVTLKGVRYKVTAISANAFKGSKYIQNVTIGSGVIKIGKNAFQNCLRLKSVTGGKNITTIGAAAFSGCKALTKITLNAKVKALGTKAFYKCSKLKTITVKTSKLTSKAIGSNAFKGIHTKAIIKVPKAKLKAYTTLFKKKGIGKNVKIK